MMIGSPIPMLCITYMTIPGLGHFWSMIQFGVNVYSIPSFRLPEVVLFTNICTNAAQDALGRHSNYCQGWPGIYSALKYHLSSAMSSPKPEICHCGATVLPYYMWCKHGGEGDFSKTQVIMNVIKGMQCRSQPHYGFT
jgi:hypothetical protein